MEELTSSSETKWSPGNDLSQS